MKNGFSSNKLIILYERQKGKCAYCGCGLLKEIIEKRNFHLDHIIPISKGGDKIKDNICISCRWCNLTKRNKTREEFLEYLKPVLEGKIKKEDLRDYNNFLKLSKKFPQNYDKIRQNT